ncbi:MAG TPA: LysR family transcriptional regulator [Rhizomicrobium sp.]|nr:LysR family transcriptional regulator [Rhizomicrobium sp.]
MARLTIRIDFDGNAAFGPGKARLLELIEQTGSLRRAASAMDMSYRRAWLLLREIEALTKTPVVAARTGGKKGGGTALTPTGRVFVDCYRAIEIQAERSVLAQLNRLAGMTKRNPDAPQKRKKVTRNRTPTG